MLGCQIDALMRKLEGKMSPFSWRFRVVLLANKFMAMWSPVSIIQTPGPWEAVVTQEPVIAYFQQSSSLVSSEIVVLFSDVCCLVCNSKKRNLDLFLRPTDLANIQLTVLNAFLLKILSCFRFLHCTLTDTFALYLYRKCDILGSPIRSPSGLVIWALRNLGHTVCSPDAIQNLSCSSMFLTLDMPLTPHHAHLLLLASSLPASLSWAPSFLKLLQKSCPPLLHRVHSSLRSCHTALPVCLQISVSSCGLLVPWALASCTPCSVKHPRN